MSLTLDDLKERMTHPIRAIHTICGGIVFFHDGVPQEKAGILDPSKVVLFNGGTPKEGDPIVCVHCGYDVRKNQLEFILHDG